MQVELSDTAVKMIDEYNETLKFKVSRTLIANDIIVEALSKVLKIKKPKKKCP